MRDDEFELLGKVCKATDKHHVAILGLSLVCFIQCIMMIIMAFKVFQ